MSPWPSCDVPRIEKARSMRHHLRVRAALSATALCALTACSGADDDSSSAPVEASVTTLPPADAADQTSSEPGMADTSQVTEGRRSTCQDNVCLNPEAEYAEFDPGFELSLLEMALMREAGPFSGDAFDPEAAYDAAMATSPWNARQWSEAILDQVHPDYVHSAQDVITFNPIIEGVADEPAEEYRDVEVVGANHFAILLDASGSMAEDAGGSSRMEQAKGAIEGFIGQLPAGSTVSLRVYGQEGSNAEADKAVSCESTEVVYEGDQDGLASRLDDVAPVGWTPLALAVQQSATDIPVEASDAIVYVVTDGIETCDGDPVEATEDLASQGIEPVVNVIGFQVGDADTQQLRDMAQAGGGQYADVTSQADLEQY